MATFRDLLNKQHNYLSSDFGANHGEVVIDSRKGTVRPLGEEGTALHLGEEVKCVALADVFKVGHYVSLDLHGTAEKRLRFVVIGINRDGLDAVASSGEQGFLPWEAIASALRWSQQVYVDALSELKDLNEQDRAFVQEEIGRLTHEIRQHHVIASELSEQLDRLESIGKRPSGSRPSSWLQGG
ncbi:hypothetical protein [Telmatospirillum sp. J64-1]|uniref:hypothetical protein n=1 Tax=Telmatospirillum sp. J64-1 TaxID=2502183 RepID=UPI00115D89BF|nr:hypothetical protein [Telmatospirillum sp. J64-1]